MKFLIKRNTNKNNFFLNENSIIKIDTKIEISTLFEMGRYLRLRIYMRASEK